MKKIIFSLTLLGSAAFLAVFIISSLTIGSSVEDTCETAIKKYQGDCTKALTQTLKDEKNSYRERNSAIWALGQLGNKKALPVLQNYYTGKIPEKEPLDQTISQYELKKAIKLLEGGTNLSAFVWRR